MGISCSLPCPTGTYGADCMQSCQCAHGSCHHVTGECLCEPGYSGEVCNQLCFVSCFFLEEDLLKSTNNICSIVEKKDIRNTVRKIEERNRENPR